MDSGVERAVAAVESSSSSIFSSVSSSLLVPFSYEYGKQSNSLSKVSVCFPAFWEPFWGNRAQEKCTLSVRQMWIRTFGNI